MFALSVSISTSSSPTATSSPTDFIHLRIVPSSIESERRGMTMSWAIGLDRSLDDRRQVERAQSARIDHLGLDAVVVRERLRRLLGDVRHSQDADDRHVGAL